MPPSMNSEKPRARAISSQRETIAQMPATTSLAEFPQPKRVAVVVLAMHRSGSNAISQVLNILGCDAPKTAAQTQENAQDDDCAYDTLQAFNDDVLASAGTDWRDWRAFNPHWYDTPRLTEFLARGQDLVTSEYGASNLFFVTDPRICRLVPFWRDTFSHLGVDPRVIIAVRHPVEVAQSLAEQDNIPGPEALLMWLRHMLDAERQSRGLRRVFVTYDRLVSATADTMDAMQETLGLHWPRLSDRTADEIDALMASGLHRHRIDPQDSIARRHVAHKLLNRAYGIFRSWSRDGEATSDHAILDQIHVELGSLADSLGPLVAALVTQSEDLSEKGTALDRITDEQRAIISELEMSRQALSALSEEHESLKASLTRTQSDAQEKDAEVAALKAALVQAHAEQQQRETEARALRAQLAEQDTVERSEHQKVLVELKTANQELQHALEEGRADVAAKDADLSAVRVERDQARADLDTSQQEAAQLLTEIDRRDEEIESAKADIHALRSALEQRSHEAEETAKALSEAQASAKQQEQEMKFLRVGLEDAETNLSVARTKSAADAVRLSDFQIRADLAKRDLEGREHAYERLRARIATLDGEAKSQAQEFAQAARLIFEKEEALKRRNKDAHEAAENAARLQQDLQSLQEEVTARNEALTHAEQRIAEAEAHSQALLESTSWKVTAPLRRLVKLVRR